MFAISADSESLKREICIHKHVQQSVPQRLRAGSIAGVSQDRIRARMHQTIGIEPLV
jgi:hypothetical protein